MIVDPKTNFGFSFNPSYPWNRVLQSAQDLTRDPPGAFPETWRELCLSAHVVKACYLKILRLFVFTAPDPQEKILETEQDETYIYKGPG